MTPLMKCERSIHDHNRYVTGKDTLLLDYPPSGNQIYFHIFPDESATLVLYFSNNDIECFVFERGYSEPVSLFQNVYQSGTGY